MFIPHHDHDDVARASIADVTHLPGHVLAESFSVLIRRPRLT